MPGTFPLHTWFFSQQIIKKKEEDDHGAALLKMTSVVDLTGDSPNKSVQSMGEESECIVLEGAALREAQKLQEAYEDWDAFSGFHSSQLCSSTDDDSSSETSAENDENSSVSSASFDDCLGNSSSSSEDSWLISKTR